MPPRRRTARLPVARLDNADWSALLSCQRNAESPSRFASDSQNFIEAWHRQAGCVLGGGGSKYAPRFSTFRKRTGSRGYIPTDATLTVHAPDRAACEYAFDADRLQAELALSGEELYLNFRIVRRQDADDIYEAAIFLPFGPARKSCSQARRRPSEWTPRGASSTPSPPASANSSGGG